jgi:hypothetical protein
MAENTRSSSNHSTRRSSPRLPPVRAQDRKDYSVHVLLSADEYAALIAAASAEQRSCGNMLRRALGAYLQSRST